MACVRPLRAFKDVRGGLAWSRKDQAGLAPMHIPCGQCIACRIKRANDWALRCMHEAEMHDENCFITLTYDDAHLPADRSLRVEDWQRFHKRLRKRVGRYRFFGCGEYGDETRRPHFHSILFGYDFPDKVYWKTNKFGDHLYKSASLFDAWQQGHVSVGNLSFRSARYVARYSLKKQGGFNAEIWYARIDPDTGEFLGHIRPEFSIMSRGSGKKDADPRFRGGIGKAWYERFKGDVYPSDEVIFEGRKYRPPRFYDNQVSEEYLDILKDKRRRAALKHPLTADHLAAREKLLEHEMDLYNRRVS